MNGTWMMALKIVKDELVKKRARVIKENQE